MAVRITALHVPTFRNGGLEVGVGWVAHEQLDAKQRTTLRDFHGRFIQVHPEDRANLGAFRLAFKGEHEPLEDLDAKKTDAAGAGEENTKPAGRKATAQTK